MTGASRSGPETIREERGGGRVRMPGAGSSSEEDEREGREPSFAASARSSGKTASGPSSARR